MHEFFSKNLYPCTVELEKKNVLWFRNLSTSADDQMIIVVEVVGIERKYFLFEDVVIMILTRRTKNIWVTFNAFRGPLKQKNNRKNSMKSIPSHSFSSIPL